MKKTIFFVLFCFSTQIFAFSNPQIRLCRVTGGQFWSLDIDYPSPDNMGFCRYGQAMIDTISLIEHREYALGTKAMVAYYITKISPFASCDEAGGILTAGYDSEGQRTQLCSFSDNSHVKSSTLLKGWSHPSNKALNKAL